MTPYMQQRLKMKQGLSKTSAEAKREEAPRPLSKATKPIAKVAPKRKEENKEYEKAKKEYLAKNVGCEAQVATDCTGLSNDIHHRRGRNAKDDRINPLHFVAVCRKCHLYLHAHPIQAKELGLSESALKSK